MDRGAIVNTTRGEITHGWFVVQLFPMDIYT